MKDSQRKAMWAKKGYDNRGHLPSTGFDNKGMALNASAQMARGKELEIENHNEFLERKKNWIEENLHSHEGDGKAIVFTNKKDSTLTVEMHPMDNSDNLESDDDPVYNAWYMFPAKNRKGTWNSPEIIDESGGYTREDAVKKLEEILVEEDESLE